jgi:hypothetical protein
MESGICHQHALISNVMLFTVGDPASQILLKEFWQAIGSFQLIHKTVTVLIVLTSQRFSVRKSSRSNLKKNKCHLVVKTYSSSLMTDFISINWSSKHYFHQLISPASRKKEVVYFKTVRVICWRMREISTET